MCLFIEIQYIRSYLQTHGIELPNVMRRAIVDQKTTFPILHELIFTNSTNIKLCCVKQHAIYLT